MRWARRLAAYAATAAASLAAGAPALAQPAAGAATVGVLATRGSVGEQAAERGSLYWLGLRWRSAAWTFGAELPWLQIRDTAGREQGLGDLTLRVSREWREASRDRTGVDLTFKLKTATGSLQRGLGTGGTDALLQLEFMRPLAGGWLALAELGWRATGNVAGQRPYANPWHVEVGALAPLGPATRVGLLAYAREPIGRLGPRGEVTLFGQHRSGSQVWRAQLVRGNGRASPEWSAALSWSADFGR